MIGDRALSEMSCLKRKKPRIIAGPFFKSTLTKDGFLLLGYDILLFVILQDAIVIEIKLSW